MKRLLLCCLALSTMNASASDFARTVALLEHEQVDLSSAAGRREADELVHRAALRWCRQFRNASRIDDRQNFFECVSSAKVRINRVSALQSQNAAPSAAP